MAIFSGTLTNLKRDTGIQDKKVYLTQNCLFFANTVTKRWEMTLERP